MRELDKLLSRAFTGVRRSVFDAGRECWLVPSTAIGAPPLRVVVDNGWISLEANVPIGVKGDTLDKLSQQAEWPGGAKLAGLRLAPGLRADVPLIVDSATGRDWVVHQIRMATTGLNIAAERDGPVVAEPSDPVEQAEPEFMALACRAAGWSAAVKPDGSVSIGLPIRGAHRVMSLRRAGAAWRASVGIATGVLESAAPSCRAATGALLLRASAALRWARAYLHGTDGRLELGFECEVAAPPDERALLLAVDTLIAACELFGREAEMLLESPAIASAYAESLSHRDVMPRDEAYRDWPVVGATALPSPAALVAISQP